jgi:hypothetical protein
MARTAVRQQESTPIPTTQYAERRQSAITATITEDDVRLRAYEIYLRRGDNPGDEVTDWLEAERELLAH